LNCLIKEIPETKRSEAVDIFSRAFMDDPLYLFAFPELEQRRRLTRIMYEFVVYDMVPKLILELKGAFVESKLAGCMIYTTPDSKPWNDTMNETIMKMRETANDKRIDVIGEYAMMKKYEPGVEYFYGNELAVKTEYRRQGIGKKLVESLITDCHNNPAAKGILIDTANINNVTLYEKWGWELKASFDFYTIKVYAMWRNK
jgi:ribosomal protein S18 acetylase RimI-like enzyme